MSTILVLSCDKLSITYCGEFSFWVLSFGIKHPLDYMINIKSGFIKTCFI